MTTLVAGGAGFIGAHLCRRLLADGHVVTCLDDLSTGSAEAVKALEANPRFRFIQADICNLSCQMDELNQIYNLACPASPKAYQRDPISTTMVNVAGTLNLLAWANKRGARFLQASTSEVYGDPHSHPQRESDWGNVNPIGPRSCYDEGKRVAESLCFDYIRQFNTDVRVARIFNTYGPGMDPEDGRAIPNLIGQALHGVPLTVYGGGSQTRSFCYIDDMIEGLIRLMNVKGPLNSPVNLGNPEEIKIIDLAVRILNITGAKTGVRDKPLPADDPVRRCPDISRAERLLTWHPLTGLDEGLAATIEDMRRRMK